MANHKPDNVDANMNVRKLLMTAYNSAFEALARVRVDDYRHLF
jgi:hypothetical protein